MAKIVVDTPTKEGLGFKDYVKALVSIILNSDSPFTIGILGEWGVGKTSLMQMMREELNAQHKESITPIWFNAWRCEREKNLAIIPLLQLLVSEIKDESLKERFINVLKSLQLKFSLPGGVELSAGGVSQNQVEGDLYYAELDAIETTLKETDKKIVVFIDDLDRCAPDKILEVLESTKVFLDIQGFVYVLGLSPEVVVKAIEQKYKDIGIDGEDYLEKIVQIPFRIPDWNVTDRGNFIADLVEKNDKIDDDYKAIIGKYKDIIQEVIERTPRQVKRFINTYICEQEIFKGQGLDQTIHLILTILKFKWYDFYQNLFDERYRQNLGKILSDKKKLREELKDKENLVAFINKKEVEETIKKIIEMDKDELSKYRRVGMIIPQKISESVTSREKLIELLRAEKVSTFNALRYRLGLVQIDLRDADLRRANLSKVNLSMADLSGANLSEVNLNMANLSEVNLSMANLSRANLRKVNLCDADLRDVDLRDADLSWAELSRGNTLVTGYQRAMVRGANFENVLTNDKGFLEYLKENGAKNVPNYVRLVRMVQ